MNIMDKMGFRRLGAEAQDNGKCGPEIHDTKERKEGETRIYNLIILDESGSMSSIRSEALTGANETICTIKAAQKDNPDDNQMLSFVTFDSGGSRLDVRSIIGCEPIDEVKAISEDMYNPIGCTPLYDAIGLSVKALKKVTKDGDNVLVTVITDGYENSSKEYNASMIKDLVDGLRSKGWVFTYIGDNQDSVESANNIGIHSSMDFECTEEGSHMMWCKMHSSQREYYKKVRRAKNGEVGICLEEDFFASGQISSRVTPERIESLNPGEIFVFGSNLQGQHAGGASRVAVEEFGAIWGQGTGLQGRSYAIPTMQGGVETIKPYVDEFIQFADSHPELTFLVTRIGCGIAGFKDNEIAPLFAGAFSLPNVYLPESFWKVLNYKYKR